jgi:hypothetical protein
MRRRKKSRNLLLALILTWPTLVLPAAAQTAPAAKAASAKPAGLERFSSSAAAAQHCPGDTVVWSTFSKSKVFHLSASKYFGKTRHGAYACEKAAIAAGYHASKR